MSKSRITLNINTEITNTLKEHKIPNHDGVGYLLCLYYGVKPSYIPEELERKVLSSGIVNKDYTSDTLTWNKPLFEETEIGFEWISEWMDLFKSVNPERRGVKADVLKRMKKFFVNNPAVRKDEVFQATHNYLKTVTVPMYCKKSHKFIYEIDGTSMLGDFVSQLEQAKETSKRGREDVI